MPGPERRLAAILSADIAGYSRLMAEDEAPRFQAVQVGMGGWRTEAPGPSRRPPSHAVKSSRSGGSKRVPATA